MEKLLIRSANAEDIPALTLLFDAYRVFYKQASDPSAAQAFLEERMAKKESILFVAESEGKLLGFTQLYPTFSSVSLEEFFILNDLFVRSEMRGQGIGAHLLRQAQAFIRAHAFKGLALETAVDNPAQKLYERLGWEKNDAFQSYFWSRDTS